MGQRLRRRPGGLPALRTAICYALANFARTSDYSKARPRAGGFKNSPGMVSSSGTSSFTTTGNFLTTTSQGCPAVMCSWSSGRRKPPRRPWPQDAGRKPSTAPGSFNSLIEIHPTGKTTGEVVWEWHVWDHLIQDWDPARANYGEVAAHPELVDINFGESYGSELSRTVLSPASEARRKNDLNTLRSIGYVGSPAPKAGPRVTPDWTHVNAVAYHAELDQIMLTVRAFSELWIIDHGTTSAEAAGHTGGKSGKGGDLLYRWGNPQAYRAGTRADQRLFAPHGAHWIPPGRPGTGHVLVFNNGLRRPGGDYSSVDEIVLPLDLSNRYASEPRKALRSRRASLELYCAPQDRLLRSIHVRCPAASRRKYAHL